MQTGNHTKIITSLEEFLAWWPFLIEGLSVLQDKHAGNNPDITADEFFRHLLHVLSGGVDYGIIMLLLSKNDKPLGYIVVNDNTYLFQTKTAVVYAIYSNNKCPSTVHELVHDATLWGRPRGYKCVQATSYRLNGAALRWFERKLGFRRRCIVFEREVV